MVTAPQNRLGWGLVGCGWVARDYVAPGIAASGNGRLVAAFAPDPSALGRLIAGGETLACKTLDGLLADPDVDAVYVATPNYHHASIVRACAAAGKHVLCEKPMATNLADARAMVLDCERAGVRYATAFDQRFQGAHRRLAALVADGSLGIVSQARIHYACWLPGDWVPDNWRVDPARAGGGALIDLAPHGVDLLEVVLGDEWAELVGLRQHRVHAYAVDDGAALVGRFRSGALGLIQVGYNCPDVYPRRTLELIGTKARALAVDTMGQTPGGRLTLLDAADGRETVVAIDPEADRSPFEIQAKAFADAILSGRPYPFAPARDLRTFALLEAACR